MMERDDISIYPSPYPQPQVMTKNNITMSPMQQQPASASILAPNPPQHQMLLLGPENTMVTCPFCHAAIKTAVKYTTNTRTHIAAALCCLVCCLCCVPYASESAKNSDHYCPNCQRFLGTYHK